MKIFLHLRFWTLLAAATLMTVVRVWALDWRWSNPLPHGNNIVDMAFSGTTGLQVCERGQIYTTSDLQLWLSSDSHTTNALRATAFLGLRAIVTGQNGTVLYADSVDDFQNGTLIDGATSNWLEGVAASPTLAVAVGDNAAIYTSTNGIFWKKQNTAYTSWLRSVTYGAGGFVTVGEGGFIATSANGTNWTQRVSGTTADLNRVRYFAGAGGYEVVGDGAVALTSPLGVTWTRDNTGSASTNDLFALDTAGSGTRLAAGTAEVRLYDNSSWKNQMDPALANPAPSWTYYSSIGLTNDFLLAGRTGLVVEGYKTNGNSWAWVDTAPSIRNWLWDVVQLNHVYVSVGDFSTIMTSLNGIDWSLELPPNTATNQIFLGVGGTTNLLVAVGNGGTILLSPNSFTNVTVTNYSGTNVVVTNQPVSTFGVIWKDVQPRPTTNELQGICAFGSQFVVTGGNGTILTSPNGTNWTLRTSATTNLLTSAAAISGLVVAVGEKGTILSSPDGISWTKQTSSTTNWIYRVRCLDGQFFAVGQNGTILTSGNGTTWTRQTSGTTSWLNDVIQVTNTFYAVGTQGTCLASTNGILWTNVDTITQKSLYAAATDNGQLVTVGAEGIILRTQIVPVLSPVNIRAYSRVANANATAFQSLYLFAGQVDQRFTADHRPDLGTNSWVTGPQFEIFDSSGTLYYLETSYSTNALPREYFRTTLIP